MHLLKQLLNEYFEDIWLPQHNSQHLHYRAKPQAQDLNKNFQTFLEDPDPLNKLMALIRMKGSLSGAFEQLDLYERHRYINNIDASKVRQQASNLV